MRKSVNLTTLENEPSLIGALFFALVLALAGWLLFGLIEGLISGLVGGLIGALLFGLLSGLEYGGGTVIQHISLRCVLTRSGHMPFRYVRFLDYAANLIFLRKVGGSYIFIHDLLMEYFAGLEGESNDSTE